MLSRANEIYFTCNFATDLELLVLILLRLGRLQFAEQHGPRCGGGFWWKEVETGTELITAESEFYEAANRKADVMPHMELVKEMT